MVAYWWKSPVDEDVGVTVLLGWRLSFAGIEIVMVGSSTSASSSPSEDMSSGTPAKSISALRECQFGVRDSQIGSWRASSRTRGVGGGLATRSE